MNQPEIPFATELSRGAFYGLLRRGTTDLIIQPTLLGLQHILTQHWHMQDRSQEAFSQQMATFLQKQQLSLMTKDEKRKLDLLTVSDVLMIDDAAYLLQGDNGLTAFQKLGRDWFIDCPCIYQKGDENAGEE